MSNGIRWLLRTTPLSFFLAAACLQVPAGAAAPHVVFDISPVAVCRDVTTAEFSTSYPGKKLIAAQLLVSVRMHQGDASDVSQVEMEITSKMRRARVFDFQPKTILQSDVIGDIETTRTSDVKRSAGVSLGATVPLPGTTGSIVPSATLGTTNHDVITERMRKIPSPSVTVVSGTTDQGHGVFFQLNRSRQTSLQGQHEFSCQFVVPSSWRGDWLQAQCRATTERKWYHLDGREQRDHASGYIGLFLEGEKVAQAAALELARVQGERRPPSRRCCRIPAVPSVSSLLQSASPNGGNGDAYDSAQRLRNALDTLGRLSGVQPDAGQNAS